ncbi:MAG TPA: NUDIX domain-containing protein [Patescibacteria group bacterium]|nr:NUDIX domain-containing protein [Patescibacteria group bacterium]
MNGGKTINLPAAYMLIRKDNQLLFVLRTNTGFMDGLYSLPAGRVEPNEAFRAAAIRETMEEVGLTVEPTHAAYAYTQHRFKPDGVWVDVFFEADQWTGVPKNASPKEHGEIAWFPIEALPTNKLMDYQLAGIEGILSGNKYGEFHWPAEKSDADESSV